MAARFPTTQWSVVLAARDAERLHDTALQSD